MKKSIGWILTVVGVFGIIYGIYSEMTLMKGCVGDEPVCGVNLGIGMAFWSFFILIIGIYLIKSKAKKI